MYETLWQGIYSLNISGHIFMPVSGIKSGDFLYVRTTLLVNGYKPASVKHRSTLL